MYISALFLLASSVRINKNSYITYKICKHSKIVGIIVLSEPTFFFIKLLYNNLKWIGFVRTLALFVFLTFESLKEGFSREEGSLHINPDPGAFGVRTDEWFT